MAAFVRALRGPREFRFEQDYPSPGGHYKLAVTAWARGALDVLHTQPLQA